MALFVEKTQKNLATGDDSEISAGAGEYEEILLSFRVPEDHLNIFILQAWINHTIGIAGGF